MLIDKDLSLENLHRYTWPLEGIQLIGVTPGSTVIVRQRFCDAPTQV